MLDKWIERLSTRLGERIFAGAARDWGAGAEARRTRTLWAASILSLAILLLPLILLGAGLWLVLFDFPNLMTIVLGVVLIVTGIAMRPRTPKLPKRCFARDDLPTLAALSDRVAVALKAPRIEHFALDSKFNASVMRAGWRRETVLTLGLVLWQALDDDERIALIGHEMAHLANDDPARQGLVASALQTLDGLRYLLTPTQYLDEYGNTHHNQMGGGLIDIVTNSMLGIVLYLVEALEFALIRLFYVESQRAEYLADALAAEVAGRDAAMRGLDKLLTGELIRIEALRYARIGKPDGTALIDRLAGAVRNPDAEARARLIEKETAEGVSVDRTHPPSHFRIAFLAAFEARPAMITPQDVDFDAIGRELAPHIERIGLDLDQRLDPE